MSERLNDYPGWVGRVSRIEAEMKLDKQPVGTFVLRDGDELDSRITRALAKENHETLQSCILTVVEPYQKISERLALHTAQGWVFYQDNPDLHDSQYRFYPTMKALLQSVENVAKKPLGFEKNKLNF